MEQPPLGPTDSVEVVLSRLEHDLSDEEVRLKDSQNSRVRVDTVRRRHGRTGYRWATDPTVARPITAEFNGPRYSGSQSTSLLIAIGQAPSTFAGHPLSAGSHLRRFRRALKKCSLFI